MPEKKITRLKPKPAKINFSRFYFTNYLKQTGIISPLFQQYFSTNSGAFLLV
jgi:hypothetical protein